MARARTKTQPRSFAPLLLDAIRMLGRLLDDLEHTRIQNGNRIAALEKSRGDSFPHLRVIQDGLVAVEKQAAKELIRAWRKHPLAPWAKSQVGIGEKSIARLIAEVGDPYLAARFPAIPMACAPPDLAGASVETKPKISAPRLVSELWAYCGVGKPGGIPKNATKEEMLARGKWRAKKQLHVIAEACIRQDGKPDKNGKSRRRSPWRDVYDARRAETVGRVHAQDCSQCKAKAGEPWKPGHVDADAARILAKRFLQALWIEARTLQASSDTQP